MAFVSKRFKSKDSKLEKSRSRIESGYICPCPECGNTNTDFRTHYVGATTVPESIDVLCPCCGEIGVRYDREASQWVTGDGAPYNPEDDDISITRYHRFDPTSFETEEEAIKCEIELIDRIIPIYDMNGDFEKAKELDERNVVLCKRSCEIGMREFVGRHVYNTIATSYDEGGITDGDIDRCIEMMRDASIRDALTILLASRSYEKDEPKTMRLTAAVRDMLLNAPELGDAPGNRIKTLLRMFRMLDEMKYSDAGMFIEKAIETAQSIDDPEEKTLALVTAYAIDVQRLGKGERLEREMEYIEEHRKDKPWAYLDAVVGYGKVMGRERPEKVMVMTDRVLEYLDGKWSKGIDDSENGCDVFMDFARIYRLRYDVVGNPDDLVAAAEYALDSSKYSVDGQSMTMLKECLKDPKMPLADKKRIEKIMEKHTLGKSSNKRWSMG